MASPLRRFFYDPSRLAAGFAGPGMTVVEPGPGMGFFTLELARIIGPAGRVIAVDIQPKMLDALRRRAVRAGLAERIHAMLAQPDSMGLGALAGTADLVWAFAVIHEMPDARRFFAESAEVLKPGGRVLVAEPAGHVKPEEFDAELKWAAESGLTLMARPAIRRSHAALLEKR